MIDNNIRKEIKELGKEATRKQKYTDDVNDLLASNKALASIEFGKGRNKYVLTTMLTAQKGGDKRFKKELVLIHKNNWAVMCVEPVTAVEKMLEIIPEGGG